ncbi:MAG: DUF3786 domain-containing protein [Syntrophobacterales bacterium]|nr:DUF3786 domain-containing protein [Syntrophobacterales bacterium]
MPYELCSEVNEAFWEELAQAEPQELCQRSGARCLPDGYLLPFLNRELTLLPRERRLVDPARPGADPGFRLCLTALLYLLKVDPAVLGPPVSPLELAGGATFFRGQHGLPHAALENRFGADPEALLAAGRRLGGEPRPAGDAALAFQVFPGLWVEVVLWRGDEEFPPQASFAVPAHLDRFWHLDAVWGLLNLLVEELVVASGKGT